MPRASILPERSKGSPRSLRRLAINWDIPSLRLTPGQQLVVKLRGFPRGLGIALVAAGAAIIAITGPVPFGLPLFVLGTLIMAPGLFRRIGDWLARWIPSAYRTLFKRVDQFRAALERRFPGSIAA